MTANEFPGIFSTARGDHMMNAAVLASLLLSLDIWVSYFGSTLAGFLFFMAGSIAGCLIPLWIVADQFPYWIDNRMEPGHFWRDLLCQ